MATLCVRNFSTEYYELSLDVEEDIDQQTALELAVAKYEYIKRRKDKLPLTIDGWSCGLCVKYYNRSANVADTCFGCPVWYATGHPFCRKTPWVDAVDALNDDNDAAFYRYVNDEIEFLRSLGSGVPDADALIEKYVVESC